MAQTYIELAGSLFRLRQNTMEPMAAPAPGYAHVFTDHDRNWHFGLADIQGPVKFADSLVRRDLRERRELSEGDRVWLYQVSRQGERFQAVYGIFSGERHEAMQRRYLERPDGLALFDGVSVALGLLRSRRPGRPKAVVVQVAETAIVAMGDRGRCHWLVRMALQDDSLTDILERTQAEAAWRKIRLDGIDVVRSLAGPSAQPLPAGIRQWPTRTYAHDGIQTLSDLEALLPRLPLQFGPVTRQEALHRPLERAEPLAWLGLAAAGLALFVYGAWLHGKTVALHDQTALMQTRAAHDHTPDPRLSPAWSELNQVQERLGPALAQPLAGEALLRLSRGMGGQGRIETIRITEHARGLHVHVQGGLPAGLDAGPLFQKILLGLAGQGFAVHERSLEVGPQGAAFAVQAVLLAAQSMTAGRFRDGEEG